jgi:hypothetical protein
VARILARLRELGYLEPEAEARALGQ